MSLLLETYFGMQRDMGGSIYTPGNQKAVLMPASGGDRLGAPSGYGDEGAYKMKGPSALNTSRPVSNQLAQDNSVTGYDYPERSYPEINYPGIPANTVYPALPPPTSYPPIENRPPGEFNMSTLDQIRLYGGLSQTALNLGGSALGLMSNTSGDLAGTASKAILGDHKAGEIGAGEVTGGILSGVNAYDDFTNNRPISGSANTAKALAPALTATGNALGNAALTAAGEYIPYVGAGLSLLSAATGESKDARAPFDAAAALVSLIPGGGYIAAFNAATRIPDMLAGIALSGNDPKIALKHYTDDYTNLVARFKEEGRPIPTEEQFMRVVGPPPSGFGWTPGAYSDIFLQRTAQGTLPARTGEESLNGDTFDNPKMLYYDPQANTFDPNTSPTAGSAYFAPTNIAPNTVAPPLYTPKPSTVDSDLMGNTWICTEIDKEDPLTEDEKLGLSKLRRYTIKNHRKDAVAYLKNGYLLIQDIVLDKDSLRKKLIKDCCDLVNNEKMEEAFNHYKEVVIEMCKENGFSLDRLYGEVSHG
jgi:hypothetical protein